MVAASVGREHAPRPTDDSTAADARPAAAASTLDDSSVRVEDSVIIWPDALEASSGGSYFANDSLHVASSGALTLLWPTRHRVVARP